MRKLIIMILLISGTHYVFGNDSSNSNSMKLLKMKTAQGFSVPYYLRYDPDKWTCKHTGGGVEISYLDRKFEIKVLENKNEKKITQLELDTNFKVAIGRRREDPSLYANLEILPSSFIEINGIAFLHQSAKIHLAPNGRLFKEMGDSGYWRLISDKGGIDQIDYYVTSNDKGTIYISVKSEGQVIDAEDQAVIEELLQGFSFDGSACKGPAKLRALKTVWEALTDK